MSDKFRQAGKSTRELANKRHKSAIWTSVIGIVFLTVLWLLLRNAKAVGIGGIVIILLLVIQISIPGFITGRVNKKLDEEKRAIRGAKAEETIGELLANLSGDYYTLNDIRSPHGNVDHIIISKYCGIFLIETKAHGGNVKVKGKNILINGKIPEKDFIGQALRNTYWVKVEIGRIVGAKPWVNTIIVFTNAFVSPTKLVKGVSIVNKKYLLDILHRSTRSNALYAHVWKQREIIGDSLK